MRRELYVSCPHLSLGFIHELSTPGTISCLCTLGSLFGRLQRRLGPWRTCQQFSFLAQTTSHHARGQPSTKMTGFNTPVQGQGAGGRGKGTEKDRNRAEHITLSLAPVCFVPWPQSVLMKSLVAFPCQAPGFSLLHFVMPRHSQHQLIAKHNQTSIEIRAEIESFFCKCLRRLNFPNNKKPIKTNREAEETGVPSPKVKRS